MKPTLVVLAAGMGSRFGGPKQLERVGPGGETLPEVALKQAAAAGFGEGIVLTRDELAAEVADGIARSGIPIPVAVAIQEIPEGLSAPPGTAHAVLAALREHPRATVGVCNGDDVYGVSGFATLRQALDEGILSGDGSQGAADAPGDTPRDAPGDAPGAPSDGPRFGALVAYRLDRTLSRQGGVNRGICRISEDGTLVGLEEVLDLRRKRGREDGPVVGRRTDGAAVSYTGAEPVSMNLWGFGPGLPGLLEERYARYEEGGGRSEEGGGGAEFRLSTEVASLIEAGRLAVRVARAPGRWFGMTHAADREAVVRLLAGGVATG